VTFLWFIIWFFANLIGDHAPLLFDPVNWWAGSLLFAVAVDLGAVHATANRRR
jgi:hypothetical protein